MAVFFRFIRNKGNYTMRQLLPARLADFRRKRSGNGTRPSFRECLKRFGGRVREMNKLLCAICNFKNCRFWGRGDLPGLEKFAGDSCTTSQFCDRIISCLRCDSDVRSEEGNMVCNVEAPQR